MRRRATRRDRVVFKTGDFDDRNSLFWMTTWPYPLTQFLTCLGPNDDSFSLLERVCRFNVSYRGNWLRFLFIISVISLSWMMYPELQPLPERESGHPRG